MFSVPQAPGQDSNNVHDTKEEMVEVEMRSEFIKFSIEIVSESKCLF